VRWPSGKEVKAKGCTACGVGWHGGRVEPASSGGTQGGVARTWPAWHGEVHRLPVGRQSKVDDGREYRDT
jgi:hypothetical protein